MHLHTPTAVHNLNNSLNFRSLQWLKSCGNEQLLETPPWLLHKQHFVCHKHFQRKDMCNLNLSRTAVPSLFHANHHPLESAQVWSYVAKWKLDNIISYDPVALSSDSSTKQSNVCKCFPEPTQL